MSGHEAGSLADVVEFLVCSVMEHIKSHEDRFLKLQDIADDQTRRAAYLAFLVEAEPAFDARMRERFPFGGLIYGKRRVKLDARARALAEALQVRPALPMNEIFRRAGVSRSAGYRILERLDRKG